MALLVPCDALACVGCLKNRISELAISAVPLTFETFDPPAAAVYVRRLAKNGTGFNRILNRKWDADGRCDAGRVRPARGPRKVREQRS
eukprot:COSAG03_NODE_3458_length_1999_cov_1.548947_2_plen_88_part_00